MHQIPDVGKLGEQVVAQWLQSQNWVILHHRWRCRWGEIDLIACAGVGVQRCQKDTKDLPMAISSPLLAFIEVKTRRQGNWDADGLLAITPAKQTKLWQTAQLFLAEHSDLATLPCRFDVALVHYQRLSQRSHSKGTGLLPLEVVSVSSVQLGQPVLVAGYQFIVQDYIPSAFDLGSQ